MKKNYIILIFIITTIINIFSIVNPQTWRILYKSSKSLREKADKVKELSYEITPDFKDIILEILNEIYNYDINVNKSEIKNFEDWSYYTAKCAGILEISNISHYLIDIYKRILKPFYKGDILISIGKTKDRDALFWLNRELKLLNNENRLGNVKNAKEREYIIEGLIQGLRQYKDPSSFYETFYATIPYSEKVRNLANTLLKEITNDPAELCYDIILNELDLEIVMAAFDYCLNSSSSDEKKIQGARICLGRMLNILPGDKTTKSLNFRQTLMDKCVETFGLLKAKDPKVVYEIGLKWDTDKGGKSEIITIDSLSKIATKEAAKLIIDKLNFYTKQLKEGGKYASGKPEGEKIIIAMIQALGTIGDKDAFAALETIRTSIEYAETIKNEAEKAISKLK